MIAGATSDGNGGTLLNTGIGTIDLVGIDPSDVSADWFVWSGFIPPVAHLEYKRLAALLSAFCTKKTDLFV